MADIAMFDFAGEFGGEIVARNDHSPDAGDKEVVAEHGGNRYEQPRGSKVKGKGIEELKD